MTLKSRFVVPVKSRVPKPTSAICALTRHVIYFVGIRPQGSPTRQLKIVKVNLLGGIHE